ncbi:MAG: LysR family transcriptional regulator [Bdellovibrionota bacterium]
MFDYNKLRTFQIVAAEQSVSRAAKRLHRTQSAISQQLAALEETLGLQLLERRGGKIHLTQEGKELFARTQSHLAAVDESILEAQGDLKALRGRITVGISPTHCRYFLVPRVVSFRKAFPNVSVEFRLLDDPEIERQLGGGLLDFGVLTVFSNRNMFQAKELFRYEERPFGQRSYVKSILGSTKPDYADLLRFQLIDFSYDFMCLAHWIGKNRRSLLSGLDELRPAFVVRDHAAVLELLELGAGVAMLPTVLGKASKNLISIYPSSKPTQIGADLAHRKKNNFRRYHHDFLEYMAQFQLSSKQDCLYLGYSAVAHTGKSNGMSHQH